MNDAKLYAVEIDDLLLRLVVDLRCAVDELRARRAQVRSGRRRRVVTVAAGRRRTRMEVFVLREVLANEP